MEHKLKLAYTTGFTLVIVLLLSLLYYPSVDYLVGEWMNNDEYSHGPLLVIIALFILWKKRAALYSHLGESTWYAPLVILVGVVLAVGAIQGDIVKVGNYSIVIVLAGIALSLGGRALLKEVMFPLFLLFMTIPLPYTVNVILTRKLQFISSELGAWFIGLFNIPVYLEGNVIELENYTLLVEEACSGLNYLYALVSIGFIWSYFFKAPRLHKALLVLSTIPIAVFMNGARVGITGVLVYTNGIEVAEGFMHEFEGLIVFLATCLLLIPVVWLLTLLQKKRPAFSEIFDFQIDHTTVKPTTKNRLITPAAIVGLLFIGIAALTTLNSKELDIRQRTSFSAFPSQLGLWTSNRENLPAIVQDVLKADDYFLADFKDANGDVINLYMVYYEKQLRTKALHSPLVCLPGHGWVIEKQVPVDIRVDGDNHIDLMKLFIDKDGDKLLVYYWTQQQGKSFSNEFVARATLVADALVNKRTDGGMVRLTTPIRGGNVKQAENTLNNFMQELVPKINGYIPN